MNMRAVIHPGRRLRILRRPSESIRPSTPRPQRRDCHGRLLAALLAEAPPGARIDEARQVPWCSATFVGARHEIALVLAGEGACADAEALAARLPETEFRLPGHIVADLGVEGMEEVGGETRLRLSVLTVEEW